MARKKFQDYIDKIMSASLGHDLVLHSLPGTTATSKLFDSPMQTFRNGRHEDLCRDLCGNIINDDTTGQAFLQMILWNTFSDIGRIAYIGKPKRPWARIPIYHCPLQEWI